MPLTWVKVNRDLMVVGFVALKAEISAWTEIHAGAGHPYPLWTNKPKHLIYMMEPYTWDIIYMIHVNTTYVRFRNPTNALKFKLRWL